MCRKHNKNLLCFARELRNNPTKEEKKLWYDFLSSYPIRFTRQKVLGQYIADFYCEQAKLVIELDGSQHFTDEGLRYDQTRGEFLEEYGLEIVRIPNNEINDNFDGVCEFIDSAVKEAVGSNV